VTVHWVVYLAGQVAAGLYAGFLAGVLVKRLWRLIRE